MATSERHNNDKRKGPGECVCFDGDDRSGKWNLPGGRAVAEGAERGLLFLACLVASRASGWHLFLLFLSCVTSHPRAKREERRNVLLNSLLWGYFRRHKGQRRTEARAKGRVAFTSRTERGLAFSFQLSVCQLRGSSVFRLQSVYTPESRGALDSLRKQ